MVSYIAITGYYGTGSSAIIDLLKEYIGVGLASPVSTEYEHVPFYYPGGLFDMYSILSAPYLSTYNSDMAINRFIQAAKNLNSYDYGWIGSYKKFYGNKYMDMVYTLVDKISRKTGRQSAGHMYKVRFSLVKAILQLGAKIVLKRPITKLGRYYVTDNLPGYYAMPSTDLLDSACREYIESYLKMCSSGKEIEIFDHLLWPQQCYLADKVFPENFKTIVARRDPRDVFLLNKYYWHKPPVTISKPYYPVDSKTFCKEWKESIRLNYNSDKVLPIFFEDLIYKYEETINVIENFLGVNNNQHTNIKRYFQPEMSIENTQVFTINNEWRNEIKVIEKELEDYLYDFPAERKPNKELWFDTEAQLKKIKK